MSSTRNWQSVHSIHGRFFNPTAKHGETTSLLAQSQPIYLVSQTAALWKEADRRRTGSTGLRNLRPFRGDLTFRRLKGRTNCLIQFVSERRMVRLAANISLHIQFLHQPRRMLPRLHQPLANFRRSFCSFKPQYFECMAFCGRKCTEEISFGNHSGEVLASRQPFNAPRGPLQFSKPRLKLLKFHDQFPIIRQYILQLIDCPLVRR